MNRQYFLWVVVVALLCLVMIGFSLMHQIESPVTEAPLVQPPAAPFKTTISGVGTIEPSSGNISINAPVNRLIENIFVQVGQRVKKGRT